MTGGGRIEKFHQPLVNFLLPLNNIGLEIFPCFASTRRQAIHRLDFFVLLYQRQKNKQNAVEEMISTNGTYIVLVMGTAKNLCSQSLNII